MRNRNLSEIKNYGRMKWQDNRNYGKRNQAERAIGRYKRILGNRLHSREFERQVKRQSWLQHSKQNDLPNPSRNPFKILKNARKEENKGLRHKLAMNLQQKGNPSCVLH